MGLHISVELAISDEHALCSIALKSSHCRPITIGGLNVGNLRIQSVANSELHAFPYLNPEIPNSNELTVLEPDSIAFFDLDLVEHFVFPESGSFQLWAIYNSLGFRNRFREFVGENDMLGRLATIDEMQVCSDRVIFEISDALLGANRILIETRISQFLAK